MLIIIYSSRQRRIKWLLLPAVFLFMAGCAAVGPKYAEVVLENPSNAIVFIYRPSPPQNIFLTNAYQYGFAPDIYHGDRLLSGLNVNAYTYVEIEPGHTRFSAKDKVFGVDAPLVELKLDAKAGQSYYLRYEMRFSEETPAVLKIMPVELARQEIRKTRYVSASE